MRHLLSLTFAASTICCSLYADSTLQEYYDQGSFEAIAQNIQRDDFNSNSVSLPGVSVTSYDGYSHLGPGPGSFVNGQWNDPLSKYDFSIWTFSRPVYAFGAHFEMLVVNGLAFQGYSSGNGIDAQSTNAFSLFMPNAVLPWTSLYQSPGTFDGFYGFISTTPITALLVEYGNDAPGLGPNGVSGGPYQDSSVGQYYTMDNLEISTARVDSATPEPSNLLPFGGLLLLLMGFVLKGTKAISSRDYIELESAAPEAGR